MLQALKQFYHKLGSPRWFYHISGMWLPWLLTMSLLMLISGAIWGLAFAPADFKQGNSFRIIYVHVPGPDQSNYSHFSSKYINVTECL